jgi:dienelactone hydrolase
MINLSLDQLRDRFGWMLGALIIAGAVIALMVAYRSGRPLRVFALSASAIALVLGCLLFIPAAPRLIMAFHQFATSSPLPRPSGPLPVETISIALPAATGGGAPIIAQVWYPVASDDAAFGSSGPGRGPAADCAEALGNAPLSKAQLGYPILLSAQGGRGLSHGNASTSVELASHGYVVLAVDDADYETGAPNEKDGNDSPRVWAFDFSSAEAFEATLHNADRKVRRLAEKALAALVRLQACAKAEWQSSLRFDQVGFFGFSIGGATAAEAGVLDARVAAVANLDGWLFGSAALGALNKPYLILSSDAPLPGRRELQSLDPNIRYQAALTERDWREEVRLMNRPDGYGYWIYGAAHGNFSDAIFDRSSYKYWLVADPFHIKSIADAYLLAFFDTHLRNAMHPLLRQTPSPYNEVAVLHGNALMYDEETPHSRHSLINAR